MANILSDAKKRQVIALGQLGWTLRRIEAATGVRRETAGAYLKAAGLAVRPAGRWGHAPKGVSTDSEPPASPPPTPPWPPRPQRAPVEQGEAFHAPAPEGELRRRRPPAMMGALRLMPALWARQRHRLLAKQFVQGGQPGRMDPREQVRARGRHPGEHRLHQMRQRRARPILRLPSLPSLCSLRHWRLLGPGRGDRLSWSTRFSRRPGRRRYSVLKFNRDRDISYRPSTESLLNALRGCMGGSGLAAEDTDGFPRLRGYAA